MLSSRVGSNFCPAPDVNKKQQSFFFKFGVFLLNVSFHVCPVTVSLKGDSTAAV